MKAIWYEQFGAAKDVLVLGEMARPSPGAGEVLVRLHATGINPSDVKLRAGARPGAVMAYPRVIPHSDGAGVIEAVGEGINPTRIGERVWIWNGNWRRPFGTAAEYIALPSEQAVGLPEGTSFFEGACLGIPAMTAWYATHGAMDLDGKTVLVTGGAGTVGRYAIQMARLGGARVLTTVSSADKAKHSAADEWINYREDDVTKSVMELTDGGGVDLVVDVDFGINQDTTLAVIKDGGVISAFASAGDMTPTLQFYPLMFKNITLRMLIVYLLEGPLRHRGEADLTRWLAEGKLTHAVVPCGKLEDVASAHDIVAAGGKLGTVVLEI